MGGDGNGRAKLDVGRRNIEETMTERFVGLDIGAETIKLVEIEKEGERQVWTRRAKRAHDKHPRETLQKMLEDWDWPTVRAAAATGRLARVVTLPRVPVKQAQAAGYRFRMGEDPATLVTIGSHGFSVLEIRSDGQHLFRENARCSQGTGNFLRQLVERFGLDIEEASALCAREENPAPLSGRCPVILKTDMTHLANKGESQARILAGLYDAVCENVQVLIKPKLCPPTLVLAGGVTRAERIQAHFERFAREHGMKLKSLPEDDACYLDALGTALAAPSLCDSVPAMEDLFAAVETGGLELLPPLSDYLDRVKRLPPPPRTSDPRPRALVMGFDIGSTGSKATAIDPDSSEVVWEGYLETSGNPVGAARDLMSRFVSSEAGKNPVLAVGVTGSGREVVGSLMSICFGVESVYILNEIAAHAEGALHFDPRVDTIFEIGGQDAKYIRLSEGRVVDAAMNEACSAGTGSFIEEQGKRFAGIPDVQALGRAALEAGSGVSLGQHCSVFMAEIIDEAVAAGAETRAIVAGVYDAVIQNYLNRVKGSRSVGDVVFCQGMPFSSDALAAAVARQTGSEVVVPPNPGLMGALGIALLTAREIPLSDRKPVEPRRFLEARVERKDTFVCKSTTGCGGAGNRCRIDRLTTVVSGERRRFTWGGGCSLYDKGTGKRKLPDRAPDPFRERTEYIDRIVASVSERRGRPTVAMTDEFMLKGLFPFFATFIHALGLDPVVSRGADQSALKRGIEEANVPFCAPMQQFHGQVSAMLADRPDFLFVPMIRSIPASGGEPHSKLCPIVQGSPDMIRWDFRDTLGRTRLVSTVIDFGPENLRSREFIASVQQLASDLGVAKRGWRPAYRKALEAQEAFDTECRRLGRRALDFCQERDIVPVVVLGRTYTIYNTVLNSNVPALLREQGALPIPVDCYPVGDDVPVFEDIYWGYSQVNLRAAHQIRRTPGQYSVFCSNYSCGPDSFSLHFYGYIMEGKPFAVIETDGHSGDAGTKTRLEAFLHCVHEDRKGPERRARARSFVALTEDKDDLAQIRANGERVLIPRMGPGAEALAAVLRGIGVDAEALPMPTRDTLRLGRRYTSGKECVPMTITLGSLLERLEHETGTDDRFCFFMPTAAGPCRFGVYNLLHRIVLERLGLRDRVRIWSPSDGGYFTGVPGGFAALVYAGFMAADMLLEAFYYARPVERKPGEARAVYDRFSDALWRLMEEEARGDLSTGAIFLQVASGRIFGVIDLLQQAAQAFARVIHDRPVPTVLMVGEIYVRCDDFANDFAADRLESRGIRVRFAPFNEWLEYTDQLSLATGRRHGVSERLTSLIQRRIQARCYSAVADILGWPERTSVPESLAAADDYLRDDLHGEAVLTIGGPVHEWRAGLIDAVLSVGPLECMPNKISEAQLFHAGRREGLLSLTLSLNGDPVDEAVLDNFAFEVWERFRLKKLTARDRVRAWMATARRILRVARHRSAVLVSAPVRIPLQAAATAASKNRPDREREASGSSR